ncbi:MAG: hypothetical protein ACJ741_11570 [Pyrinomonadaceae bacterium]
MLPVARDARVCMRCGRETMDEAKRCASCGGAVVAARTMRRLGWVMVLLGAFLFLFMGAITIYVAQLVFQTRAPGGRAAFEGSPEMEFFMFGLFGFVLFFGVTAMVSGALQVRNGRSNRKLMLFMIGLGLLFIIIGRIVRVMRS